MCLMDLHKVKNQNKKQKHDPPRKGRVELCYPEAYCACLAIPSLSLGG